VSGQRRGFLGLWLAIAAVTIGVAIPFAIHQLRPVNWPPHPLIVFLGLLGLVGAFSSLLTLSLKVRVGTGPPAKTLAALFNLVPWVIAWVLTPAVGRQPFAWYWAGAVVAGVLILLAVPATLAAIFIVAASPRTPGAAASASCR